MSQFPSSSSCVLITKPNLHKEQQQRSTPTPVNSHSNSTQSGTATSMKSPNKAQKNSTPPSKRKTLVPRRSSAQPSASPPDSALRQLSAPQYLRSSPPIPASKPTSSGPDWMSVCRRRADSPSYIPVPINPVSAKKNNSPLLHIGKGREGVRIELTPPTPRGRVRGVSNTPKISSPLLPEIEVRDEGVSSVVRRNSNPSPSVMSRTSSIATLSPFVKTSTEEQRITLPQTRRPVSSSLATPIFITSLPPSPSPHEKHDSFSPLFNNTIFDPPPPPLPSNPSSPLLPFSSTLHPYTSTLHITPSCTSGSLTHRLSCTHLILTSHPSLCKSNCVGETPGFGLARLMAQGFLRGAREGKGWFVCGVCAEVGKGEGVECLPVLERGLLGGAVDRFGSPDHGREEKSRKVGFGIRGIGVRD